MFDLKYAIRIHPKPETWGNLIKLREILYDQVEYKVGQVLSKMMADDDMIEAIRGFMNVSDRYNPTRRDGFNYLAHTYKAAVETDTDLSNWDCVLEIWPDGKSIYIRPILGGAIAEYGSLIMGFQEAKPFNVPGRTREQTKYRETKWAQLTLMWEKPLVIEVCTTATFGDFAGKVV